MQILTIDKHNIKYSFHLFKFILLKFDKLYKSQKLTVETVLVEVAFSNLHCNLKISTIHIHELKK